MFEDKKIKINPIVIAIGTILITWLGALTTNFGNARLIGPHSDFGAAGATFDIGVLLLPVFFKDLRKDVWSKKGLISLILATVVNLPVAVICFHNYVYFNFGRFN